MADIIQLFPTAAAQTTRQDPIPTPEEIGNLFTPKEQQELDKLIATHKNYWDIQRWSYSPGENSVLMIRGRGPDYNNVIMTIIKTRPSSGMFHYTINASHKKFPREVPANIGTINFSNVLTTMNNHLSTGPSNYDMTTVMKNSI